MRAGKRASRKAGLPGGILAGWIAGLLAGGLCQAAELASPMVQAVELRVLGRVQDVDELEPLIEVIPGQRLDREALRRTLRNLHASGLFSRLEALTRPGAEADHVIVMLLGERSPLVGNIRFEGDLKVLPTRLRRRIEQWEKAPLDRSRMDEGVQEALDLYRRRGYFEATVDWRLEHHDAAQDIVVVIDAGPRASIGEVRLEGDQGPYGRAELEAALRLSERFDRGRIGESAERLRLFLAERGHLAATVESPEEIYDAADQRLKLAYRVQAGPLYEVETTGVERRWLERRGFLPLKERPLALPLLNLGCSRLREYFQGKGHFRAQVDCRIEDLTPTGAGAAVAPTRQVVVEVAKGSVYEVVEVGFTGNRLLPSSQLEPLLRIGARKMLRLGSGRLISRELQEDVENLRSYYLLQGFLDVEIGPTQISEESPGELSIVIPIEEKSRRRVVGLEISGVNAFEADDLLKKLALEPGGGYHPLRLEDSLNALRTIYEEEGYPAASVEARLDWGADQLLVDVRLEVVEGLKRTLDRLVLRGLQRTRASLIKTYAGLEEGEELSRRKLLQAERELYRLGIFSEVDVGLVPSADDMPQRNVAIRLDEGRRWRLAYGLSYHSDDGIGGLLGLSRTNLRGLGERLQLDIRTSENDNRLRLFYDQPMPFGMRLPLTWTLFLRNEVRPSFEVEESGFRVQMARDFGAIRLGLLYDYRLVELQGEVFDLRNLDREDREVEISSIAPNFLFDRRDDPLDPNQGWSLAAQVEFAFPFARAEAHFLKLFTQHTRYLDLFGLGTLAGSMRFGLIEPLGDRVILDPILPPELESSRIPISERFFAGGRTTHRAYARDSLGVLGQSRIVDPETGTLDAGGNGLFLLNVDWRFPISGPVGGVAFLDLGNVWADWRDMDIDELRPGIGLGVRYASPVGPVRLEIGWKLDPQPFEDDAPIFLLSFGNPF